MRRLVAFALVTGLAFLLAEVAAVAALESFAPQGHYSAEANRRLAEYLWEQLADLMAPAASAAR